MAKVKAALAIDGGGVRGVIPARVFSEIELRTGRAVASMFSLIAGSSIGGVLALTLAKPAAEGALAPTAAEAGELLLSSFGEVFLHRWWHNAPVLGVVGPMLRPKYASASAGAHALLRDYFGDARMGQALTDVIVSAYDIGAGEPRLFRSYGADGHLPMSDVAQATTAAPGFYAPFSVECGTYVDGAVFANNAGMIAYTEMVRQGAAADEIAIVSVGAGRLRGRPDAERAARWGFFHWGPNIVRLAVDGAGRLVDSQLASLLGDEDRFFRIEADIAPELESLDDISPANLRALAEFAEDVVCSHDAEIDRLCELLLADAGDSTGTDLSEA